MAACSTPDPAGAPGTSVCQERRALLRGAAALGLLGLGGALTACGGGAGATATPDAAAAPPAPAPAAAAPAAAAKGTALGASADIPVGSGKIYRDAAVVVTQPTKGDFKAFSAICTHTGCVVAEVADGTINCICHGSKFSITDGSVVRAPAPKPLPAKDITVSGGEITLA